jgi:hypothetical protein
MLLRELFVISKAKHLDYIFNNFMQLFFGWEAVGLVAYLLIGFWHHKESAIAANLKEHGRNQYT